jgi:hypothetical protein
MFFFNIQLEWFYCDQRVCLVLLYKDIQKIAKFTKRIIDVSCSQYVF